MFSALRQASRSVSSTRALRTPASRPVAAAFTLRPLARTLVTTKYTKDHEAVIYDDQKNIGKVTITDYAQTSLGDVVFVELPTTDTEVAQGESIGAVESVKAASDIFSPVSGKVVAINEELGSQPSLVNKSPEDKGWLCEIELSKPSEMDDLMSAGEYQAHCEES
ncbi:hypothetical protein EW146_g770 [Bondarzewia mesenterica]|uniref:Glycine cleavage system H protein n=1 Tax=Bondarzewia mesenterica TaxID=1095465 RepID=A0A4S4M7B6_9AGAM|nr:hypothetical protein EW146_g770 [Bondarzewia mesenterica]